MDYGPSAHLSAEDSSQAIGQVRTQWLLTLQVSILSSLTLHAVVTQLRERVQAAMVQEYLTVS